MSLSVLYDMKNRKRRYRVLLADTVDELSGIEPIPSGFVLLWVDCKWAQHESAARSAAGLLLQKGMRYACTWANGVAQGLHDLIDRIRSDQGFEADGSCISTSWHDKDPLNKAIGSSFIVQSQPSPTTPRAKSGLLSS